MKWSLMAALFCVLALAVGCQTAGPVVPGAETVDGKVVFSATGCSVAASESGLDIEKARVAAAVIAKGNLLELIKGARVNSSVSVDDLEFASQEAATMVEGLLARARITYAPTPEVPAYEARPLTYTATASLALAPSEVAFLKAYAR